jgi:hypothetical protein
MGFDSILFESVSHDQGRESFSCCKQSVDCDPVGWLACKFDEGLFNAAENFGEQWSKFTGEQPGGKSKVLTG